MSVLTEGAGDETGGTLARDMKVYPNPVRNLANLQFTVPEKMSMNMVMFDVQGRQVRKLYAGEVLDAGQYEVPTDFDVSSGVYWLSWGDKDHATLTRKIVVVK